MNSNVSPAMILTAALALAFFAVAFLLVWKIAKAALKLFLVAGLVLFAVIFFGFLVMAARRGL